MPKAAELDIDLNSPAHLPAAATAPRTVKERRKEPEPPKNDTPVNFRWPAAEVKAMKKAALDADMTMQDFMLRGQQSLAMSVYPV
jgi:hypothetical protein